MRTIKLLLMGIFILPVVTLNAQDNEYINGISAAVTLGDGTVLDGEVQFEDMNYASKFKSYFYETLKFKEDGDDEFFRLAMTEVDNILVTHKDNSTKMHVPYIDGYYPLEPLAAKLQKSDDPDSRQNLNPGYIMYTNGDKVDAKIGVIGKKGIGFYSMENGTNFKMIKAPIDIKYVAQIIDGKEIRYLRIKERYEEWFRYNEPISYIENPYPTHRREGAERFVEIAAKGASMAAEKAVYEAQYHHTVDQDGHVVNTGVKKHEDMEIEFEMSDATDDLFSDLPGKGGIFFNEYILMVDGAVPEMVYKENWEAYIARMLEKCPNINADKKVLKILNSFSELDTAIGHFNKHNCQ